MNEEQSGHTMELTYILEDLERISNCMIDLFESAKEKINKKFAFSKIAMEEISESFEVISVMYEKSVYLILSGDKTAIVDMEQYMKKIAKLEKKVRKNHKKRIKEGKCKPEFTSIFSEIFHSMERIGEHCNAISEEVLEDIYLRYLPEEQEVSQG